MNGISRLAAIGCICVLSAVICAAEEESEGVLYYEPFLSGGAPDKGEYAADKPLDGQGPASGGATGEWVKHDWSDDQRDSVVDRITCERWGLRYPGLPTADGSIKSDWENEVSQRALDTGPIAGKKLYISFLYREDAREESNNLDGFAIRNGDKTLALLYTGGRPAGGRAPAGSSRSTGLWRPPWLSTAQASST